MIHVGDRFRILGVALVFLGLAACSGAATSSATAAPAGDDDADPAAAPTASAEPSEDDVAWVPSPKPSSAPTAGR